MDHSHDVGQTLHGIDGSGFSGTRDGRVVCMQPGQTVCTPPGEEHWHGASSDILMSHLALLDGNEDGPDPTRRLERVTDEQYRAPHDAAEQPRRRS